METNSLAATFATGTDELKVLSETTADVAALFILALIFLLFSALLSGAKVSYLAMDAVERKKFIQKKNLNARLVKQHLEKPDVIVASIRIARIFFNTGFILLSWNVANLPWVTGIPQLMDAILKGLVIITVIFFVAELFPKIIARRSPAGFSSLMAVPMKITEWITAPIRWITEVSISPGSSKRGDISVNEITDVLEINGNSDLSDEKEILEGIVKFGNKSVVEIMKPRVDVVAVDIRATFPEVLTVINSSGYSRMPVYHDSFDNIKGVLYIKDLLPHSHKGNLFKWQTLIRPPFYVPETKKINSLLEEFQKNKVHLAVVVDEYGGTAGIVTLEDILEEIVGDISDELDDEESYFSKITENTYLFDGKTLLVDFYKVTGCDDTIFNDVKGEADTLAGLILEIKGEIPVLGEKIPCKHFEFTIEGVDRRRIRQIKVEIIT